MSFYGKVTNSSKTQFSFDKIYPTRHEMDTQLANNNADGIFVGRYVLVEYGDSTIIPTTTDVDTYIQGYLQSTTERTINGTRYVVGSLYQNISIDDKSNELVGTPGQVVVVPIKDTTGLNHDLTGVYTSNTYWICMEESATEGNGESSLYWCLVSISDSNYTANYEVDKMYYGAGRGYDSTVWTLTFADEKYKFVMVAELNSVVPTFDVEADAPTDAPMSPHWSNESTSVYYKLHVQPNWGMRLKKATTPKLYKVDNVTGKISDSSSGEVGYLRTDAVDATNLHNGDFFVRTWNAETKQYGALRQVLSSDEYSDANLYYTKPVRETMPSDELVVWMRTEYNKETGKLVHYYYSKNDTWQEYDPNDPNEKFDSSNTDLYGLGAAIYYNKAGFDPEVSHFSSDESYQISGDEIQFGSTGRSGHDYDSHGKAGNYEPDIKELSVMLPSLGDSVAKMWDVVYGDREMNNLNENGELTRNMVHRYVRLYLTEAEFNDKINELNNLNNSDLSLKRLHYKDKNGNYLQLGSNPTFNANLEYYQLKQVPVRNTDISWVDGEITAAGGEPKGLRLIHQDDDGWTYSTDEVATVAGAINSVHDLMGMIITEVSDINSIEELSNIDNNAIIYYTGETKELAFGDGDTIFSDPKYTDEGVLNYTTDTYLITLEHNHYYIKGNRTRFKELDTDKWQTLSDITELYKKVQLVKFSNDLFYKIPKTYTDDNGVSQTYYDYYKNLGETVPDPDKIYLKTGYPVMNQVSLMPAYSPETYYYKDGNNTYKLATSPEASTDHSYYSLEDAWTSGDIYVPGCYYIKNGSNWETTFTPAYYFIAEDGDERFIPNSVKAFKGTNTYYGINSNDVETNYVKVVNNDGSITYEQQKTYKINRAQSVSLIDYNNENAPVLEAFLEDYAYTPLDITNASDYAKCYNMINSDGNPVVLYRKNKVNAGQMEVAGENEYETDVIYYSCHWDDNGNWNVDNALDSQGTVPVLQTGYLKNKYFTYRYKPITIAPTEYAVYSPSQWDKATNKPTHYETIVDKNKKTWYLIPVDSDFSALCKTGKLYKASTNAEDYTKITLNADTYIPNTYFYLYVDGDKETYTLDTSASFNEKRDYYQGAMEQQSDSSEFDSTASYFMLAPIMATEAKKIKNIQYYRFTELTQLKTDEIFDYDDISNGPKIVGRWDKTYTEITIADKDAFEKNKKKLYTYNSSTGTYSTVVTENEPAPSYSTTAIYYTCTDSIEDEHYRLKDTMYDKACVSATFTSCNLYEANKYYHKVTENKTGYELDTSPLGQTETGYVISNKAFDENQTYYVENQDGTYVEKPLTQDTYEPGLYYVTQFIYKDYYKLGGLDQALLNDNIEFYQQGQYYYQVDDAYYIDNGPFNPNRTYYKITPIYVIQDDLNAYTRGAEWNINILPVPDTVHVGTREEKTTLHELKGFGRTYNTINGLIVKIRQLIGTDEGANRDTATILGAAQKIRDLVAQFGAMTPSQALVVDGYGRVRSAESNCGQIDEITNYGEAEPKVQQLDSTGQVVETDSLSEPDRRIKDRWINITLPIYNYKGRMYTDYESLEAVIKEDQPQFAYSLNNAIVRYYYQWTPETEADFEKAKDSLYTATIGETTGIYTVLTNVKAVDYDTKFGAEGVEYWHYLADQAVDTATLDSEDWINILWTEKEARHHLVGNKAEFQVTHTFLGQEDTATVADKNCEPTDKTTENKGTGINASEDDTLQLYTPIVDSKGHVVAHNEETVTLPYGFKYLKTNGAETQADVDLFTNGAKNIDGETDTETKDIKESESKATNTKDLIQINSGNKWVQVGIENNIITLDHEIHNIDRTAITSDFNADSENIVDTLTVQDTEYDNAGHVVENHKHTYTLPYSFKKIEGANSEATDNAIAEVNETKVIADNTQDTLTIAASNKWVHIDTATTEDTVYIGHETHIPVLSDKDETDINGNGDTITIQDIAFDEAGHMISNQNHTYRLPYGFKTIHGANSSSVETGVNNVSNDQVADSTQDTLTIAASNKWIRVDTATEDTVQLGHEVHEIDTSKANDTDINGNGDTITIQDTAYDEAGHLISNKSHKYTLPFGYKIISDGTTASMAQSTQDTFTITGDAWVKPTVAQGNLTLSHLPANTTGTQAYRTDDKPALGGAFSIPTYSFDANGHIYESSTYSVTLPSLELTTSKSTNKAELVTGLSYTTNGTEINYTTQNLSSILLTGYTSTLETPIVEATDSLAEGIQALENSIHTNSVSISTNANNIATNVEAIQAAAHSVQFSYDNETGVLTANVFDANGNELQSTNNTIALTDLFYTKAEINALLNIDTETTE